MSNRKSRVLILGGGFGGLYAALEFEKRNDPRFEVTVVNRENFFLFTPMRLNSPEKQSWDGLQAARCENFSEMLGSELGR